MLNVEAALRGFLVAVNFIPSLWIKCLAIMWAKGKSITAVIKQVKRLKLILKKFKIEKNKKRESNWSKLCTINSKKKCDAMLHFTNKKNHDIVKRVYL